MQLSVIFSASPSAEHLYTHLSVLHDSSPVLKYFTNDKFNSKYENRSVVALLWQPDRYAHGLALEKESTCSVMD